MRPLPGTNDYYYSVELLTTPASQESSVLSPAELEERILFHRRRVVAECPAEFAHEIAPILQSQRRGKR